MKLNDVMLMSPWILGHVADSNWSLSALKHPLGLNFRVVLLVMETRVLA